MNENYLTSRLGRGRGSWWPFRRKPEPTVEPEPHDPLDDCFLDGQSIGPFEELGRSSRILNGGIANYDRDPAHALMGCQIVDCMRPSEYTVLTLAKLNVYIPWKHDDGMREWHPNYMPTYQEYKLCDRCYEKLSKIEQSGTRYVTGPKTYYNPAKDTTRRGKPVPEGRDGVVILA